MAEITVSIKMSERTDFDNIASELASKFGLKLRAQAKDTETLSHALIGALHHAYVAGLQTIELDRSNHAYPVHAQGGRK